MALPIISMVIVYISTAVSASTGFFYNQLKTGCPNGYQAVACAVSSSNLTLTSSKGYCSSACNKMAGCGWFNYIDSDVCNSSLQQNCFSGKCQLFTYQPNTASNVAGCTLWQVCVVETS
jgi:hypothetical protein